MSLPTDQPLPSGTVTFLFTDIEGSTRLWEEPAERMRWALARHDALAGNIVTAHGGTLVKSRGEGDSLFCVFVRATDALAAACDLQRALVAEAWPEGIALRTRMALHTGEADLRDGDYFGPAVNRCARLRATAHGGQILLSAATNELVQDRLSPGMALLNLGEHRLRDLQRSERVFQLLHPDLPAEFPALRSLDALPNNLPQQVTSFVDRDKEVGAVKALLAKTRLLSLTGSGGTGKTRLSLQVAADVLEEYPDGVWLVELAPLADSALVPQTVAAVLGIREVPGEPLSKTLLTALKNQHMLLMLDNCEHMLEGVASLVDAILHACSCVQVLVSSREALNIGGESTYRVPSLSLPDLKQPPTPNNLVQYEAARLFIERAVAAKADFVVTNHNARALASVCHRLDGIPLVLELAAARIRSMTVEELEKRLADRFRLLTSGSRTALVRHRTLRATIDWSYGLLDESQQQLLARLSIFAGGWTLQAAEAVCVGGVVEAWDVLNLLAALVDKSLVLAEEQQEGSTRYRLLETVRQYACEQLATDEAGDAYRCQHRDYFLALAEEAKENLNGPQQAHWLDVLETEHDNLRQALTLCLEQAQEQPQAAEASEKGLRLGGALHQFWWVRGHLSEGRERLAALLSVPLAQKRTQARAKALNGAGVLAQLQFDYASARPRLEESLEIFRELGDKIGLSSSLSNLGNVAHGQGDLTSARSLLEESLSICKELGNKRGIGIGLNNLGNVAFAQGDLAKARALWEECLLVDQEVGVQGGVVLNNLAFLAKHEGRVAEARRLWQTSLREHEDLGDRRGGCMSLRGLAELTLSERPSREDTVRAVCLLSAVACVWEEIGTPLPPNEQQDYERELSATRQVIGEEAFSAAWEQGQAMSWEQAVERALADVE